MLFDDERVSSPVFARAPASRAARSQRERMRFIVSSRNKTPASLIPSAQDKSKINSIGDATVFMNTKFVLSAALILSSASAALASAESNLDKTQNAREWAEHLGNNQRHEMAFASNNYDSPDWAPVYVAPSAITCPTLEGYPDCHPDARASGSDYSSRHPVTNRSQHQRRP